MSSSLLSVIGGAGEAIEELTVTWNRWSFSDCSSTAYGSGKTLVLISGTNGVVVGTIGGLEVLQLSFYNTVGYGSNAIKFAVQLNTGSALPQSFFTSIEVPGKFTLLTSAVNAFTGGNRWEWNINTPFLANGSTSPVYVK